MRGENLKNYKEVARNRYEIPQLYEIGKDQQEQQRVRKQQIKWMAEVHILNKKLWQQHYL